VFGNDLHGAHAGNVKAKQSAPHHSDEGDNIYVTDSTIFDPHDDDVIDKDDKRVNRGRPVWLMKCVKKMKKEING
jgi:hypothetical protein